MNKYICKFCGDIRKNKNALTQHTIRCKLNPNQIDLSYYNKDSFKNKCKQAYNIEKNKKGIEKRLLTKYGKQIQKSRNCKMCNKEWKYIEREK